jgi:hypothetical protein
MQSSSKIIALVMGANKSAGSLRTVIGEPADRAWSPAPCSTAGQRKGASS